MDVGRATRIGGWLFPALAGLVPVLGVLVPLGLAPLIGVAGLVAAWALIAEGSGAWRPRGAPSLLFALLFLLGAVSASWAVDPAASLLRVPKVAGLVIAGGLAIGAARYLDDATRHRMTGLLAAGLLFALLLPALDTIFHVLHDATAIWQHNRGLSVSALLIWPASLLLARHGSRRLLLGLWVVAVIGVFLLESESAKAALVAGLIAAGLTWRAPKLAPAVLAGLAVAYLALAPLAHQRGVLPFTENISLKGDSPLPYSARHRLLIWEFAAERIAEKPLLGWGFDGARRLPGGKTRLDREAETMPLHPHSAVLQIWVELGAVGAALAAALIAWTAVRLRRIQDRAAAAAATGYFAAAFTLLSLAFGVWQSWWLAALFLTTALLAAALPRET